MADSPAVPVREIHQAALDAIAARQAGDFAAYSAALNRLYTLGVPVNQQATLDDLNQIAADASPFSIANLLGSVEKGAVILVGVVLAILVGPALVRMVRGRR